MLVPRSWLRVAAPLAKRRGLRLPTGANGVNRGPPRWISTMSRPSNALPPVVVALAVVIFGLELMFQAATAGILGGQGGVGWRLDAIRDFGVFDEVARFMWQNGIYPTEDVLRLVTYPPDPREFRPRGLSSSCSSSPSARWWPRCFSPLAFVALFLGSAVAGALGFVVFMNSPLSAWSAG